MLYVNTCHDGLISRWSFATTGWTSDDPPPPLSKLRWQFIIYDPAGIIYDKHFAMVLELSNLLPIDHVVERQAAWANQHYLGKEETIAYSSQCRGVTSPNGRTC